MSRPRAREAGVRFGDVPTGSRNTIADVEGVKVGHCTLRKGDGKLVPGEGPVRTGVTVILPHGDDLYRRPVKGTYFALNGCGGLMGAIQVEEFGMIDSPIGLTNTMGMASVAEGLVRHTLERNPLAGIEHDTVIPVVSECDDAYLNDARGLHVRPEHVLEAMAAASDDFSEGAVGAGTGMVCYDFKGGIGTSSRTVEVQGEEYVVGIIVLSNHGERKELIIDGVPVGKLLDSANSHREENGSIVTVV